MQEIPKFVKMTGELYFVCHFVTYYVLAYFSINV